MLTIDLKNLKNNYQKLCAATNAQVAGVIKANGYGLGMAQVFEVLKSEGCDLFFVATPDEAFALRALDKDVTIAVLGGLWPGLEADYRHHNIIPVLNSPEMIVRWKAQASSSGKVQPAILHIDTGMNRLGLSEIETRALIDDATALDGLDVQIVMSHFACADEKDHAMTRQQADLFHALAQHFPKVQKSLANSSGLFRDASYHYDIVRPGIALYGGNPTPETGNPMQNVVTLEIPVLQVRDVRKGQSIGYGASHVFEAETQTATIALGYADGFLRSGSGTAQVYYNGKACPVLGRVSMDLVSIGIGHLEEPPSAGAMIEILGPHQGVDDLAATCGTIGYEILTSLGTRYKRVYRTV